LDSKKNQEQGVAGSAIAKPPVLGFYLCLNFVRMFIKRPPKTKRTL